MHLPTPKPIWERKPAESFLGSKSLSLNAELLKRRQNAVPRGVATATVAFADRCENAEIWDADGNKYIDFASGIAVLATGHRHPKVMAAVTEQLGKYTHTAFQVMAYEPYIRLAENLNAIAPFKAAAKTIFFTTGAEAVENAVKIARIATKRTGVITFSGSFHGRTLLTATMTGKVVPYRGGMGVSASEIYHVPFPVAHYGVTVEQSLKALDYIFKADIEPARVAAIVIEPVQGEGGFHVAPPDLLMELRRICDREGILLIADEIQTGFGRTGKMFAIEHSGVQPDLVTVAKSLGGGFPISGVIGKGEIMDMVEPGGMGGTYGGSPVGCAASLAVLDVIKEEKLMERANEIGVRIKKKLEAISQRNDTVPLASVRGNGAMIGFDIVKERGGHVPDGAEAKAITARAFNLGLVLLSCGVYGETIRILTPLTASDAIITEGLDRLEKAMVR